MKPAATFTFLLLNLALVATQLAADDASDIAITVTGNKTRIETLDNGGLHLYLSPSDSENYIQAGHVSYSDFGAAGDGVTDDANAIAATHAFANQHKLKVNADSGATYFISGKERVAYIQTDTDFGKASFIIDDTAVENREAPVFQVSSRLEPIQLKGLTTLKRNQKRLKVPLPGPCLIAVTDDSTKRYIRFGPNVNDGYAQTDIFAVDAKGRVDRNTPIIWDFDQITDITAIPIDEETLTIKGGTFTTIANQAESKYNYHQRNIAIRRSNVIVDGLKHLVTGEGEQGAPYGGFINIRDSAQVTVQNTVLTGRKTYSTIGRAGVPVKMGSYDILVNRSLNVSFVNCSQTNDIHDRTYWGIMGSNYSKNLLYDNCTLSRFDAHMGVANATIRNSTLGHMGINAIGTGTLLVENTSVHAWTFVNLRSDYGSTWQGDFIIRDCRFIPGNGAPTSAKLIGGYNSTQHDFGYTCYMPQKILITNLHIDDSNHPDDYQGPALFNNFTPEKTSETFEETYPYIRTRKAVLRNVTTASGKALRISDNPYQFESVKVVTRKR